MKLLNHQSSTTICWTTFVILSLTALTAHADFCGSDDFSSGSANWDAVINDKHASLKVTNGRYEYTATGAGTVRDEVFYRWNVNQGSYTNDWAVQVDVHLSAFPGLTSEQSINMDLVIQEGTNINHLYDVAIDRSNNGAPVMDFYTGLYTDSGATYSTGISNPATNASLRISFDSMAQTLTAWYATNSAANGDTWIPIETINIPSDWGMTAASQFNVGLAVGSGANGSASGSASDIAVTNGQAYFENFVATSSACPTNATPTNGGTITSPTFSGTQGLYDVTGVITNIDEDFLGNRVPANTNNINQDVSITQSAAGALTGGGNTTMTLYTPSDFSGNPGTFTFSATYTARGTLKSSGANEVLSLAFIANASKVNLGDGVNRTLKESITYLITINPTTGTMSGRKAGSASVSGGGSIKILDTSVPEQPAPPPLDWYLSLTSLTSTGTKVTGTGTVNLANGRIFPFTVKGTYSATTATSKLTLTGTSTGGTDSSQGATLTVTMTGNNITGITGSLLGQKVNLSGL